MGDRSSCFEGVHYFEGRLVAKDNDLLFYSRSLYLRRISPLFLFNPQGMDEYDLGYI